MTARSGDASSFREDGSDRATLGGDDAVGTGGGGCGEVESGVGDGGLVSEWR